MTTTFLYDGDALVAEYDGADNMTRRYGHWVGADVPMVSYAGASLSSPTQLFADHQGSIVGQANGAGVVTAINRYDEYGIPGAEPSYAARHGEMGGAPSERCRFEVAALFGRLARGCPTISTFTGTIGIDLGCGSDTPPSPRNREIP